MGSGMSGCACGRGRGEGGERCTVRAPVVWVVRVLWRCCFAVSDHSASFSLVFSYFWRFVTAFTDWKAPQQLMMAWLAYMNWR